MHEPAGQLLATPNGDEPPRRRLAVAGLTGYTLAVVTFQRQEGAIHVPGH
jgi:hypothetical protein